MASTINCNNLALFRCKFLQKLIIYVWEKINVIGMNYYYLKAMSTYRKMRMINIVVSFIVHCRDVTGNALFLSNIMVFTIINGTLCDPRTRI